MPWMGTMSTVIRARSRRAHTIFLHLFQKKSRVRRWICMCVCCISLCVWTHINTWEGAGEQEFNHAKFDFFPCRSKFLECMLPFVKHFRSGFWTKMDWSNFSLRGPSNTMVSPVATVLAIVVTSCTSCCAPQDRILLPLPLDTCQLTQLAWGRYSKGGGEGAMAGKPPGASLGGHRRAQTINTATTCKQFQICKTLHTLFPLDMHKPTGCAVLSPLYSGGDQGSGRWN